MVSVFRGSHTDDLHHSSVNDTQRALPCRRSRAEDLNGRGEIKRKRGRKRRARRSCDARGGKEEDERGAAAQRQRKRSVSGRRAAGFVGEIHGALTQHFGPLAAAFMGLVLFKVRDGYLWRTTALTLC